MLENKGLSVEVVLGKRTFNSVSKRVLDTKLARQILSDEQLQKITSYSVRLEVRELSKGSYTG